MNKQAKTKIILSIFLVLVVLSSSIYLLMPDKIKIVVEKTYTSYYVWEDEGWVLGGTERVLLWEGSTKMRAKSRIVNHTTLGNITTITRTSIWKDNITLIEEYLFDSTVEDVELVPIEHKVQCIRCQGKIVHFEYKDIAYLGITRPAISPESFGHNMKVEWEEPDNFMWAKVYQQKVASDKLIIRYRALDDDETFSVRMFDPIFKDSSYEFDTVNNQYNSLVQIDSTHYLNVYSGVDSDGYAVVLKVNDSSWDITKGAKHEFDTERNSFNSLVQIDSTHYLNAYQGYSTQGWGYDGFAVVLTVNDSDWTVDSGDKYEYDPGVHFNFYNSLVQIDSTHYLNTYLGYGSKGYASVLIINNSNWSMTHGTKYEFESTRAYDNSLVKIDSTHYLNIYTDINNDGFAVVLTVNDSDWTITSGTKHEFDTIYGRDNSLVKIDSTHYLNTYSGVDYDGFAVVLTVNDSDWTITSDTKEFDTVQNSYNSLAQIDSTHYLNVYSGVDSDGYAVVLTYGLDREVELGSDINIPLNAGQCVDIAHPDYGINFSCDNPTLFNIDYFRTNNFNDSTELKNLTYTSLSNQTTYIDAHQFDEVLNLSLNFTEHDYTTTSRINVYINETLSNSFLYGFFPLTEDSFSDADRFKEIEWAVAELKTIGYFNLPHDAILLNASLNLEGYDTSDSVSYDNASGYYCESIYRDLDYAETMATTGYDPSDACVTVSTNPYSPVIDMEAHDGYTRTWENWLWYDKDFGIGADYYTIELDSYETQGYCSNGLISGQTYNDCDSKSYLQITDRAGHTKTLMYVSCYNTDTPSGTTLDVEDRFTDGQLLVNNTDQTLSFTRDGNLTIDKYDISAFTHIYVELYGYLEFADAGPTDDCSWQCSSYADGDLDQYYAYDGPNVTECNASFDNNWNTATFLNTTPYDDRYITLYENISGTENMTNSSAKWVAKYILPGDIFKIYAWNHTSSAWAHIYDGIPNATVQTARINLSDDFMGTNLRIMTTMGDDTQTMGYYEGKLTLWDEEWVLDPYLEIGSLDGTREWNYTGLFETSENTEDFVSQINSYISSCDLDSDGYCLVPVHLRSSAIGGINVTDIEVNFTIPPPQIYLDNEIITAYLESSINFTQIPIKISSSSNGTMELSDIRYDYKGGNKTYEILVHNYDYSSNESNNVTVYYSDFEYSLPPNLDYIYFLPYSYTQQNVQPFGQSSSIPIFNITSQSYGGKDFSLYILLDEELSCVNFTASPSSSKSEGSILANITWHDLINVSYLDNLGIWLWADYGCTPGQMLYTDLNPRACCDGCTCAGDY